MKHLDRLIIKAKKKIRDIVITFAPFIVPDEATACQVERELEELYGDRPYSAVIIYGEDELTDDTEGVNYHTGGEHNGKTELET